MTDVIKTAHKTINPDVLYEKISEDIRIHGYSLNSDALPMALRNNLCRHISSLEKAKFRQAKVGRNNLSAHHETIRADKLCWITHDSAAEKEWLDWVSQLQNHLNRHLFLGLFSFESHFAHYSAGDFYKRHYDAFKGERNRILSLVVYLNKDWLPEDDGNLILYADDNDVNGIKVSPSFGTVAVFLSDEFAHEVQITQCDRYSIAGWFRGS